MKLKQIPEDFIVDEVNEFTVVHSGKFKLYSVRKKGVESFFLINWLAKNNNIPQHEIGIGGLKDKHALTTQFLTIPSNYDIKITQEKNIHITFIGYVDDPIQQGDLLANKFTITARAIQKEDIPKIKARLLTVQHSGVPNYFDSQRFGSVINGEFMAKHVILGQYEKAVKIFLTEFTKSEKPQVKDEKKKILASWSKLETMTARTATMNRVLIAYRQKKNWLESYKAIPENLRSMYLYAYQSYIWNECIRELLKQKIDKKKLYSVAYPVGSLLFYTDLTDEEKKSLPETFITVDEGISTQKDDYKTITKVLEKEGITLDQLNIKRKVGNYLKASPRNVFSFPTDFSFTEPQPDELNSKRFKVTLKFTLNKGSYATIITKKVFGH